MPNDTTVNGVAPAGIVADDLTGATDSAVQFAREGWAARLALTMPAAESAVAGSVVAVVTDARAQDADTARANTASAVVGLRDSGAERLFVKIDSTMRGSVIDQVAGALDGWSSEHPDAVAVVCSAYPAMGRTVENGHILVNGEGVHTTSVGTDPVTPVTTSDLTVLLPGSVPVRLSDGSAQQNADLLQAAFAGGSRIAVVDAKTDADLALLAESVTLLGPRAIPVGAAGLAVAMSHVWSTGLDAAVHGTRVPVKRVAVVVSSLHDVSRAQAERLKGDVPEQLLRTFAPGLDVALDPDAIGEWIAARLAETVTEAVFDHESVDGLVLLGGEGARAVLEHLGAEALLVRDAIREGIPLGALEGGKADGITVVTKAGGFGEPTAVAEIVSELLGATALTATELNNTEGTS
jgi:uncharacterized protein YgbK (DUF1537 family)